MRAAPIQINGITFRRVHVQLDVDRTDPADSKLAADVSLDLAHVEIATHVSCFPVDESPEPGHQFFVILRVVIDNQTPADGAAKYSPYLVDIEAGTLVSVQPGVVDADETEELAVVNGTSLLWSAIREQLSNLSARMPAGLVTLPAANFRDLKRRNTPGESPVEQETGKNPAKPARKYAKPRKG